MRCLPPRIATEHDSTAFPLDHTDTGGVDLTDALEVLDGPAREDGSIAAAGRPGPGRSAVGAARVGAVVQAHSCVAAIWPSSSAVWTARRPSATAGTDVG